MRLEMAAMAIDRSEGSAMSDAVRPGGMLWGADAVAKRCCRAIAMVKRTWEALCEATHANVRSWAALPQSRRSVQISGNRCAHV
jgi:hypothetical protein